MEDAELDTWSGGYAADARKVWDGLYPGMDKYGRLLTWGMLKHRARQVATATLDPQATLHTAKRRCARKQGGWDLLWMLLVLIIVITIIRASRTINKLGLDFRRSLTGWMTVGGVYTAGNYQVPRYLDT